MATLILCAVGPDQAPVARYQEAAARQGYDTCVLADSHGATPSDASGVVAVTAKAAARAAEVAARHGLRWHDPGAVRLSRSRLHWLGRLTASGMAVPRFATLDGVTGEGVERLVAIPMPWRVTHVATGRQAVVGDGEALQALATNWTSHLGGDRGADELLVEADIAGPEWMAVGLLDEGALRVVGTITSDDRRTARDVATHTSLTAPAGLARDVEGHLAGLVARACATLGLRQGPIVAAVRPVERRPCLTALWPGPLASPLSDVLALVDPAEQPVTLEELIVRHAAGVSLDGYALDGRPRTVTVQT